MMKILVLIPVIIIIDIDIDIDTDIGIDIDVIVIVNIIVIIAFLKCYVCLDTVETVGDNIDYKLKIFKNNNACKLKGVPQNDLKNH